MSSIQMLKIFFKKNKREISRLIGLVLFLSFVYIFAHVLMQEEKEVELLPVVVEKESEEDTETDLRFPVLEEENTHTEMNVYEQIKTVNKNAEF